MENGGQIENLVKEEMERHDFSYVTDQSASLSEIRKSLESEKGLTDKKGRSASDVWGDILQNQEAWASKQGEIKEP